MKTRIVYDKPGRYEITIPFEVEGESLDWVGIVDGRRPGEYELHVVADHRARNTEGRVTVRAVAGEGAQVRLYGVIKIGKEAQQTNDFLELRILTLDKTARGLAEPVLEIEANEVKASHAASVGPVDPEQMLYLMSRGLSEKQAQEQIVNGYLMVE